MPRITKHGGPSIAGTPSQQLPTTPADMLRAAGKLGPYGEDEATDGAPADETAPLEVEDEGLEETAEVGPAGAPESEGTGAPARPALSASKAEWVTYVSALTGQPEEEVNASGTRAELIEMYGSG